MANSLRSRFGIELAAYGCRPYLGSKSKRMEISMTRLVLGVLWVAVVGTVGCTSNPDLAAERENLAAADRAFARATAARGVEGWVANFANDGVMFQAGAIVRGHAAIEELMAPAFSDSSYSLSWEPEYVEVASSADLGYTVGRYESRRVGADGVSLVGTGTYVTIWRRDSTGSWKVVLDIGSPDEQ
jgi:ketosteroid isomerase-like protein